MIWVILFTQFLFDLHLLGLFERRTVASDFVSGYVFCVDVKYTLIWVLLVAATLSVSRSGQTVTSVRECTELGSLG